MRLGLCREIVDQMEEIGSGGAVHSSHTGHSLPGSHPAGGQMTQNEVSHKMESNEAQVNLMCGKLKMFKYYQGTF